jgi:hypothetical protein
MTHFRPRTPALDQGAPIHFATGSVAYGRPRLFAVSYFFTVNLVCRVAIELSPTQTSNDPALLIHLPLLS